MTNELAPLTDNQRKWLVDQGINEDTWRALQASLFPGANPASVQLYWHYCRARKLDPMKKPAHIVPMPVTDARTGNTVWQDVIMPGIAEARITATRTQQYAGQDEPEWGPIVDHNIGGATVTAPEWCTVRVHKLVGDQLASYSHIEFFSEAVQTKKDGTPNKQWRKRPRGQLAKCAEAGALRKAFPEELGGTITADEANDEIGDMRVLNPEEPHGPSSRDALRQLGGEARQEPSARPEQQEGEPPERAEAEPGTQQGDPGAGQEQQPARQANTVSLYDADGVDRGQYKRQGAFVNALVKLIAGYDQDPQAASRAYQANGAALQMIRNGGRYDDKLDDLDKLVERICAVEAGPAGEVVDAEWVGQYDATAEPQGDDAIESAIRDGLETAIVSGDVENIRARIGLASRIADQARQGDLLDELDEALGRAQGQGQGPVPAGGARGAFGGDT